MDNPNEDSDLQEYVPKVTFEQIPIKNLVSNQNYQRHLSKAHVKRVAENFNIFQINPVKVSRRDGVNYVFNGQHTIETVALVSGSRNTPVWCMVYDDLDYQQEADIFANQLKYTKGLNPYEVFVAKIEAGIDQQLIIKELVESYHLVISSSKVPSGICAIAALEQIYFQHGYHTLDRTIRIAVNTWEGEAYSLSANMLKGIAHLITTYGDDLKDEQFFEKIGACSVKEIIRIAKDRNNGKLGFSEALLSKYNQRMKAPLKQELLYSSKSKRKSKDDEVHLIEADT